MGKQVFAMPIDENRITSDCLRELVVEFVLQVHNPRIVQCTIDKQLSLLTIRKEQTAVPFIT